MQDMPRRTNKYRRVGFSCFLRCRRWCHSLWNTVVSFVVEYGNMNVLYLFLRGCCVMIRFTCVFDVLLLLPRAALVWLCHTYMLLMVFIDLSVWCREKIFLRPAGPTGCWLQYLAVGKILPSNQERSPQHRRIGAQIHSLDRWDAWLRGLSYLDLKLKYIVPWSLNVGALPC